ncbi:DUF6376 family protein [Priestia megaterium]|uniref:DUF6376 family protein n=1 Tax=Priestia megaterium TaxID=1404 RepID=UPI001BEB4F5A|nr:DUF6376 family protein [Priestia megaterium]MBT2254706.1 hypothetical protein [Priestia megaterium]MBT2278682.1 hypothetical protein [Priestia megaterium]
MKKWMLVISTAVLFMVGGCSFLEDTSSTLNYANDAKDYVSEAQKFAEEIPPLAEKAVNDDEALKKLEQKLQEMKRKAEEFNKTKAPDIASDVHDQLVQQNEKIISGIEAYEANIKDGSFNPEALKNSELFQSIQDVSSIMKQIKELGQ